VLNNRPSATAEHLPSPARKTVACSVFNEHVCMTEMQRTLSTPEKYGWGV